MSKPTYHIHMDAASLPAPLMEKMLQEGGFHLDDFPHQLKVNGETVQARHLTKYLYAPTTSHEAKEECLKLKRWAQEFDFKGLIQCEFVMEESLLDETNAVSDDISPPFQITSRALTKKKGDSFKKHEVHLELNKSESSPQLIHALRETGLQILENDATVTFTTSGHTREMLAVRKSLKHFLAKNKAQFKGKLTYEATAFWSLHDIEPETLPMIVDEVKIFQ